MATRCFGRDQRSDPPSVAQRCPGDVVVRTLHGGHHRTVLESAVIGEHYRIFHDAERVIADPIVRNRGTVGGSLYQADRAEDLSAVAAPCAPPWSSGPPPAPAPCRP